MAENIERFIDSSLAGTYILLQNVDDGVFRVEVSLYIAARRGRSPLVQEVLYLTGCTFEELDEGECCMSWALTPNGCLHHPPVHGVCKAFLRAVDEDQASAVQDGLDVTNEASHCNVLLGEVLRWTWCDDGGSQCLKPILSWREPATPAVMHPGIYKRPVKEKPEGDWRLDLLADARPKPPQPARKRRGGIRQHVGMPEHVAPCGVRRKPPDIGRAAHMYFAADDEVRSKM